MDHHGQKFPGLEHISRLLKKSSATQRRKLLKAIGNQFPDHFLTVYRESFIIEDIQFFNKESLLKLADHCDNTTLSLILYELPQEFQNYFLSIIKNFKANEIRYILNNFSHHDIKEDILKAQNQTENFIKNHFFDQ